MNKGCEIRIGLSRFYSTLTAESLDDNVDFFNSPTLHTLLQHTNEGIATTNNCIFNKLQNLIHLKLDNRVFMLRKSARSITHETVIF